MPVSEAVERVLAMGTDLVEVTGGEPLEQEAVYPLLERAPGARTRPSSSRPAATCLSTASIRAS